jgi:hypothetical protein
MLAPTEIAKTSGHVSQTSQNDDFIELQSTRAWLTQFEAADLTVAIELLRSIRLVSADQFAIKLRNLVMDTAAGNREPIGLYVEREVPKRNGEPLRLFRESRTKAKRAYGGGPQLVRPLRAYNPLVGSEGIVAQLVSELCSLYPHRFLASPGPDQIRRYRVRRFVLVTDFIGSGTRAFQFMEAAWKVKSVRSWWSAKKTCGMDFEVVAFAATQQGLLHVQQHPACPIVTVAEATPTVQSLGYPAQIADFSKLCQKYSPPKPRSIRPLGYKDGGALLAFSHGVPNNAPKLLFGTGGGWTPLFPSRVTSESRSTFGRQPTQSDVAKRLIRLGQVRLASAHAIAGSAKRRQDILLLLSALGRSPRYDLVLSARTGLSIDAIQEMLRTLITIGLVTANRRLTNGGRAEILYARKTTPARRPVLHFRAPDTYYPKRLRAPKGVSS